MEEDEVVLSEVHMTGQNIQHSDVRCKDYTVVQTRFLYSIDSVTSEDLDVASKSSSVENAGHIMSKSFDQVERKASAPTSDAQLNDESSLDLVSSVTSESVRLSNMDLDEDGDQIICRRSGPHISVITIEHTMATRLMDVGLQVWQGCLLLCDYILDQSLAFKDSVILEMGGGTGLASIVMATVAKGVICTDIGDEILTTCQKNIDEHHSLYTDGSQVIVRQLDWYCDQLQTDPGERFTWTPEDLELYQQVDTIIAADVVYDDDLTDAFFRRIYKFLCDRPMRHIIVALERRLNFTYNDLDVSCPAYDHYRECLDQLCTYCNEAGIQLSVAQMSSIHQSFHYQRSKNLELWKISRDPGD